MSFVKRTTILIDYISWMYIFFFESCNIFGIVPHFCTLTCYGMPVRVKTSLPPFYILTILLYITLYLHNIMFAKEKYWPINNIVGRYMFLLLYEVRVTPFFFFFLVHEFGEH
jgi:hypothetical protein